jgi:hypothetical protein
MNFATLRAHCRPRPAIPALLVLLMGLMIALPAAGRPEVGPLVAWGMPIALVVSAGLALAAGFCSFFPPIAWLAVVALGSKPLLAASAAAIPAALAIGAVLAIAAIGIQGWRVATGRFVPTPGEPADAASRD